MFVILSPQEKWDSMTRKWKDNCLLQQVRLFLIDEVIEFASLFTDPFRSIHS